MTEAEHWKWMYENASKRYQFAEEMIAKWENLAFRYSLWASLWFGVAVGSSIILGFILLAKKAS